jgi:hypothetical protein
MQNLSTFTKRFCLGEIAICIIGLAASLIPFPVYTDPFWGVRTFADQEMFATTSKPGVIVLAVDSGSPVAAAGIQRGDRVISVNGKPVGMETFRQMLETIQVGQPVTIACLRDEKDLHLEYQGEARELEGVLFLDWQFAAAPIFLVFTILLIATQPIEPAPLWRAILATLCGLTVLAVTVIVEATQRIPWTWVWQSKPISHAPSPNLHYAAAAIATVAGLALAFLGAFDVRAVLIRKTQLPRETRP